MNSPLYSCKKITLFFRGHYQSQTNLIKHIFQMSKVILFALLAIFINSLTFSHHAVKLGNKFQLKFDYAARQNFPLEVSSFSVLWNGEQLNEAFSKNYEVLSGSYTVFAKVGENILNFVGTGTSKTEGASISHVELVRKGKCGLEDILVNGDFADATNVGKGSKIFTNGIRGWKAEEIEIAYGPLYNQEWEEGTIVCQLNTNDKSDLYQSMFLNDKWEHVAADQIPA